MWQRRCLHRLGRLLFWLLTRTEIYGMDNIPRMGGAILAANHLGRLDAPLVFVILDREDVTGLVTNKYEHNFFFHWLVESVGGIWVNRESADFHALRKACEYLQRGGILGIAPEGTRSRTGALSFAKTGVAFVSDKAEVPLIPVGITGTEHAVKDLFSLHRPRLCVRFGEPFWLPPLDRRNRANGLRENTDEIMHRIAVLLPVNYRGVYR